MTLPDCGGPYYCLPPSDEPYPATLDDIEAHFVDRAPETTRDRRSLIMRALRLHCDVVARIGGRRSVTPTVLLDGGFVTWKPRSPEDADLVVLVPPTAMEHFIRDSLASLWTLSGVDATLGEGDMTFANTVVKPGFGLIDSYVAPDLPALRETWGERWSSVRDPETKTVISGHRKGYIKVVTQR